MITLVYSIMFLIVFYLLIRQIKKDNARPVHYAATISHSPQTAKRKQNTIFIQGEEINVIDGYYFPVTKDQLKREMLWRYMYAEGMFD